MTEMTGKKKSLSQKVAWMRLKYHANFVEMVNACNQLHILSDDKAEETNKRHVMVVVNDILPRLGIDPNVVLDDANKKRA